jgi:ribosome recycling factor
MGFTGNFWGDWFKLLLKLILWGECKAGMGPKKVWRSCNPTHDDETVMKGAPGTCWAEFEPTHDDGAVMSGAPGSGDYLYAGCEFESSFDKIESVAQKENVMASAMAGIEALKGTHLELKTRMEKSVEDFRGYLLAARTGRANVHMLDQIKVDYYGTDTPIAQMGQVSTPEPTLILVQPYDVGMVSAIEKAIRTSSSGLNPMTDGKVIRVPVPPMTEERRKDVVKQLNKTLEDHKTAIRNIRRDGNDQIKKAAKDKLISADDEKRANEEVQQLTDQEIKRIEELFKAKEKEILTV